MNIFFEIHSGNLQEGPGSFESTKKAYLYLGKNQNSPKILDIGCGPGRQSIDLAKISGGTVFSVDNHQPYLDSLSKKIKEENLEAKIFPLNGDMLNLSFDKNWFDIIWCESAIYNIGFQKGLQLWKSFLKTKGYLVVSEITWLKMNPPDEIKNFWGIEYPAMTSIKENLRTINKCNYDLEGYFTLPESDWWDYYNPILTKIKFLREKYKDDESAIQIMDIECREIELFKKYSDYYGYVFYIIRKK